MILKIILSVLLGGPCCPFHDSQTEPVWLGTDHSRSLYQVRARAWDAAPGMGNTMKKHLANKIAAC
jgi:hypothetical protein